MAEHTNDPLRSISMSIDQVLMALFNDSLEGIIVANKASDIVMANLRAEEIFGYRQGELLKMNIAQLIPPDNKSSHDKKVVNYWENPRSRKKRTLNYIKGLRSDAKLIPLDISLTPIQVESGSYVITHIVDQSERGKIKQSFEEQENLLQALIEHAVDGVIIINTQGVVESVNPSAARLFGYETEEMVGNNVSMLMPEPHRSGHDGYLQNYHDTGEAKIIGIGREVEGKKKDGSRFPFYLSVSRVETFHGHLYAGIVHDLTDQKAAEDKLRKYSGELEQRVEARTSALAQAIQGLQKEIQERKAIEEALRLSEAETQVALQKERELNELKSRFVSMASHEFRTPLATILSSLNLLEKYQDPAFADRRGKHIKRIKANVHNLTGILNDFLSLSKLEEGIIEVANSPFDIKTLSQEVKEDIETQSKEGQTISYTHEGEETQVNLDPKLMGNILINLLSNAVKYSDKDALINLSTKLDDQYLYIEVKDEGMGIPEDEMQHLFERFFRAKNASNISGTGLGLSIVKRHVELMKGEIKAESTLNIGTTFRLTFPRNFSHNA